MLFLAYIFCPRIVILFQKEKKKILVLSLVKYFDLVWCLYNDLWRPFILFDDAYDLHLSTQVIDIWSICESRDIAGKDHSSTILVVGVKIEETHNSGVVGIYGYSLNNDVLIVVVFSF